MDVFKYLGCTPRSSGKVVQLVKNFEEVPESKIEYPLYAQVKKDGVYAMVVNSRTLGQKVFGRTGKALISCQRIADQFEYKPEGVYIGELCFPGRSLEVLSGIVNPNRVNEVEETLLLDWEEKQEFHVHDHLFLYEFAQGFSERVYLSRLRSLYDFGIPHLHYTIVDSACFADDFARRCIEAGEEGAVFKRNVGWEAGHKGWRAMKRVRHVDYDLLCIDYEEGKGKYADKVANLVFRWKDNEVIRAMLGKNYTHEDASRMFLDPDACPIGHVYRVYGLQDSSKGKIRLPKVGELRIDKAEPDF